jgi:hypothetical protein
MSEDDVTPDEQSNLPAIPTRFERQAMVRVGRPSKLTAETVEALLESIEEGQTYKAACHCAAISYQTFRNWIERAHDDIASDSLSEYVVFLDLLSRAEAVAERKAVRAWTSAFTEDYRAARDFLERRNPEQWGRRDRVDINAKVAVGVVLLPSLDGDIPPGLDPSKAIAPDTMDVDSDADSDSNT